MNGLGRWSIGATPEEKDAALELYKMEYERCAIRYEDIYKAIWTNFSYLAVVAGATLTFGGDRFHPAFSALIACLPLIFWWLATFEPLDYYGNQVAERMRELEDIFDEKYGATLGHYKKFASRKCVSWEPPKTGWTEGRLRWRVSVAVRILGIILIFIFAWLFCFLLQGKKPIFYHKSEEAKIMTLDLKEKPLGIKISGIDLNELKNLLQTQSGKDVAIDLQEDLRAVKMGLEEIQKLLEKTDKEGAKDSSPP